ncbi:MAG TPA: tetratricopeptide repeat protein [Desulfonatronum sp.]|nr:tetratricopeptide repeat protein [Desulfonatronum sp.]
MSKHKPSPQRALLLILIWLSLALPACAPKTAPPFEPLFSGPILEPEEELKDSAMAAYSYLLAHEFEREGRPNESRQALQDALQLDPSPFLSMELANSFWREGKTEQAREILIKAIDLFPENRVLFSTLINAYLAENMADQAIAAMDGYLRRHPHDLLIRQELAGLLLQYSRFSHAADILEAVPENEKNPELRLLLARSKAGLGLTAQAEEELTQALSQNPEFIEALAELAYLYENQGDLIQAEEVYQRILEVGRDSEEILLRLIQLNVKLNQPDKALSHALSQSEREPFVLEAALIFLRENFFEQAKSLLALIPENNGSPEADFYRALAAFDGDKDMEQALYYLGRIPEDHAHYARALSFQGHLLLQLERPDEALDLAREGQDLFPQMSDFLLLEAEIMIEDNQPGKAAKLLEQARTNWPQDTDVLYRLGFLQEQMGQRSQAMRIMEDVVALDPDHAEALNFIGYTLAEEGQNLERALVLIENALKLKPGSGHIIDSLAWVLFRMGNAEEAWKHIQSAVEIMPDDPTIWEHYGDIALGLNKIEKAKKGYQNALKHETKQPDAVRKKLEKL